MLGNTLSKDILEHITKGKAASVTTLVYIGLFTELPESPTQNGTEVSLEGYSRLQLGSGGTSQKGLHDKYYFDTAIWDDDNKYFKIYNKEDIQMASISQDEDGSETVAGFGLFNAKNGGTLLAYGPIVNSSTGQPTTVTLTRGSVPIFYAKEDSGDFELRLS